MSISFSGNSPVGGFTGLGLTATPEETASFVTAQVPNTGSGGSAGGGGSTGLNSFSGAPTDGVDDVQTLTISGAPTGGTFDVGYGATGPFTAALAFDSGASAVRTALEALPLVGAGNVEVTKAGSVFTIKGIGANAGRAMAALTARATFTGGTTPAVVSARVTSGVDGTLRSVAARGALLSRIDTGELYINQGSAAKPAWKKFVIA